MRSNSSTRNLLLLLPVVFILSCTHTETNNLKIFQTFEENLGRANIKLNHSNKAIFNLLNDQLAEPATHEKALIWHPKAALIQEYSDNTMEYIENLKAELTKEVGRDDID